MPFAFSITTENVGQFEEKRRKLSSVKPKG